MFPRDAVDTESPVDIIASCVHDEGGVHVQSPRSKPHA